MVNKFKYLGYIFTTKGADEEHLNAMEGKMKKAINVGWGLMKRAGINNLKKRSYLLQTLGKTGGISGVEV